MTLIDHFNAFQEVSMAKRFSANARSLYFAILGEFNRLRYPAVVVLPNAYLQNLSGISSSCSFDRARNALLNAGLIQHRKQCYALAGAFDVKPVKGFGNSAEKVEKTCRKSLENPGAYLPYPEPTYTEKEGDEDAPATTATAAATPPTPNNGQSLPKNTAQVLQAWKYWGGEKLSGGKSFMLIEFENRYGTAALLQAIEKAGKSDRLGGLSIRYLEAVLERRAEKKAANFEPLSDYSGTDAPLSNYDD